MLLLLDRSSTHPINAASTQPEFELLLGTKMKSIHAIKLIDLITEEIEAKFLQTLKDAKQQIHKDRDGNRSTYNLQLPTT